jgi:hypothetical protein
MRRSLIPACLLLPLVACGDPADKPDDSATPVERDGSYAGTMLLEMTGGGGEGSCEAALTLGVMEDGEPAVSGAACCPVQGLSSHGDVDICIQLNGVLDEDDALSGDLIAYEQGDSEAPNGSWTGSFDSDDALVGSGSGAMEHDMGSTSFELLYDVSFALAPE